MPVLVHAVVVVVLKLNSLRKGRAYLNIKENLQINTTPHIGLLLHTPLDSPAAMSG
jgi:hypothetical protein